MCAVDTCIKTKLEFLFFFSLCLCINIMSDEGLTICNALGCLFIIYSVKRKLYMTQIYLILTIIIIKEEVLRSLWYIFRKF